MTVLNCMYMRSIEEVEDFLVQSGNETLGKKAC